MEKGLVGSMIILAFIRAFISNWHIAILTVLNTIFKYRLNRGYFTHPPLTVPIPPGKLIETHPIPSGARFRYEQSELEIQFMTPAIVRLSWRPGMEPIPYSLAKLEWDPVEVSFSETTAGIRLATTEIQILAAQDGSLHFYDSLDHLLREELPPLHQPEHPGQELWWNSRAYVSEDEKIYGLGEHAAPLNHRGGKYTLWNTEPTGVKPGIDPIYLNIPVYLSISKSGSYVMYYENSFRSTFDFQAKTIEPASNRSTTAASFEDGMLRYYFIPGTPKQAIERYTLLTGRAPLPPRWALGYHQSRWGYKTEADIRQVVKGFEQRELPLDAIHLDIDYMDGYRIFTVNKKRFPDLKKLIDDLHQRVIKLVTILDPGLKRDTGFSLYRDGLKKEVFCKQRTGKPMPGVVWPGWAVFPDFTNPVARRWWGDQYVGLLESGVDGFWHDMNEPSSFSAGRDHSLPLCTQHNLEGRGGDHRQAHNLYGLLMNRAGFEGLRRFQPERRPWIVSRSGWAGLQRYAWNWTGDTRSSWEMLHTTIPTLINMGLSGLPYAGSDIGGYNGNPSAELYLRWFQMSTFVPFFRTHTAMGNPPREPWVYGEPFTSIIRKFLLIRRRLMPYLYTLAWEASQTGAPLVRPLFWPKPDEPDLWEIDDSFLLGDALLVAPVLEPGATSRSIQLPGGRWYDFWNNAPQEGPGRLTIQASLEEIPLMVRAGSILPTLENEHLVLDIYPDIKHQAQCSVYSDDGDGYGLYRIDYFTVNEENGAYRVHHSSEGDYPFPYKQVDYRLLGDAYPL